jgi:hypothetical protein
MAEIPTGLKRTKQAVEQDLLGRPGVVGVGIGYKEVGGKPTDRLAIRVLVEEKRDVPDEERIPPTIEGYPTDVLQRRYEPHGPAASAEAPAPPGQRPVQADGGRYDVLVGGISVGPQRLVRGRAIGGTLGAIVKDDASGEPMMLSCFHVLAGDRSASAGDAVVQPARPEGGLGDRFVAGRLARFVLAEEVDAAVAGVSRAVQGEILGIGEVQGTADAEIGQQVRKQGFASGLTHGTVDTVELTVQVRYPGGIGLVTFDNQINVTPDTERNEAFGEQGDSGAVLVTDDNRIVGLYIAGDPANGNGMANPIAAVFSALGVDVFRGSKDRPPTDDGGGNGPTRPPSPLPVARPCAPCPPRLAPAPSLPAPPCLPPPRLPAPPCLPPPCLPPCLPPPCLPPPCLPPPCLPPPCLPPPCLPPPCLPF